MVSLTCLVLDAGEMLKLLLFRDVDVIGCSFLRYLILIRCIRKTIYSLTYFKVTNSGRAYFNTYVFQLQNANPSVI